ncbi:MAG TPA: leucyl aminopeptidase family protein, partial [Legionellaceae bacterium]|nr:leucyl aminopeptidase family protein [Legionellaceae bacterium]
MKSHSFYQALTGQAIPLTLYSIAELEAHKEFSERDRKALSALQFGAKLGEVALILNHDGALEKVYIGSGEASDILAIAYAVLKLPAATYYVTNNISERAILAWALAQYQFEDYQKIVSMPRVLEINPKYLAQIVMQSDVVFMIRDLINKPTNALNPETLARTVKELADLHHADYHVWVGEELLTHHYPAIHAVGRAAASEPRLISLDWGKDTDPKVTLVGKGVCFDSGGLDLKNASGMRLMKKDMGGAAHVIGLAHWLMSEKLPIRLQV